jgi:hypothetical protein
VKVFEQIKKCKPSRLFIAADGPAEGAVKDEEKCMQSRKIIEQIDWHCEVDTLFREKNLGCKVAVSSGIDWFFSNVEKGIILEDDTLPNLSFFRFCEELLEYYNDDDRIMMISGDNFQFGKMPLKYSYYFSRYTHIWGWATWRRAWRYNDIDMKLWPELMDSEALVEILGNKKEASYWTKIFSNAYSGNRDAWGYCWLLACWLQNGLNIIPSVNLISNIGFGYGSTHTRVKNNRANLENIEIRFPLSHPPYLSRNSIADKIDDKNMFSHRPVYKKVVDKIYSLSEDLRQGKC